MDTPCFFAKGIIICPAVTSVSLLARAMFFPASIPAIVGRIPIIPTIAVTKISVSGIVAISISPSIPATTFTGKSEILTRSSLAFSSDQTATVFGENSRICSSSKEILFPAAIPTTSMSLFALTTSNVCVPIEPVEPKIAIFFIFIPHLFHQHNRQVIDNWCSEYHTVKSV